MSPFSKATVGSYPGLVSPPSYPVRLQKRVVQSCTTHRFEPAKWRTTCWHLALVKQAVRHGTTPHGNCTVTKKVENGATKQASGERQGGQKKGGTECTAFLLQLNKSYNGRVSRALPFAWGLTVRLGSSQPALCTALWQDPGILHPILSRCVSALKHCANSWTHRFSNADRRWLSIPRGTVPSQAGGAKKKTET